MSFTLTLNDNHIPKIQRFLADYEVTDDNIYVFLRAKYKDTTITLYKTNKLLIQGKNDETVYQELCRLLDIEAKNIKPVIKPTSVAIPHYSTIGSDEVGTGDFFGSIVVVAAFVPKELDSEVLKLGVTDSKLLTDAFITDIAPVLMKMIKFSYVIINNQQYNNMWKNKKMNMNQIKAVAHNFVINNLTQKIDNQYDDIIIDAFTNQKKYFEYLQGQKQIVTSVRLIEKAEKMFTAVAAASVIARYIFIKDFERISNESGYILLKGASDAVDKLASRIIKEHGETYLSKYAKMNFKNLTKAKNS